LGAPGQVGERVADGIDVFDVHGVLSVVLAVCEGRDFDTWPRPASKPCRATTLASGGRRQRVCPTGVVPIPDGFVRKL